MKTYYEQLGVERAASSLEIKRAFRREIARYHPDKVQHLGPEFLEIATARAAELTRAYRVLADPGARREYDGALGRRRANDTRCTPDRKEAPGRNGSAGRQPSREREHPGPSPGGRRFDEADEARARTADLVRRAVIARLRDAVTALTRHAEPAGLAGFDVSYRIARRRLLFGTGGALLLLARIVPTVDRAAVEDAWLAVAKSGTFEPAICLILLGMAVAPAGELSAALARPVRTSRKARPIVVPVDIRTWEALFPREAPAIVRRVIERLRSGR